MLNVKRKEHTMAGMGTIVQVLGPVVDVQFPADQMPGINHALEVVDPLPDGVPTSGRLVLEVAADRGNNWARCVAIGPTEGLRRGMRVRDSGAPISAPVGSSTLGRIFNVLGEPVDGGAPLPDDVERWPIHREPPALHEQTTQVEIFPTGIKAIDLLAPFRKGGKV